MSASALPEGRHQIFTLLQKVKEQAGPGNNKQTNPNMLMAL